MKIVDLKQTTREYQKHKALHRKLNVYLIVAVSIYIVSLWGGLVINKNPLTICHDSDEPVPQADYALKGGDSN